nr:hypothetical protein [Methylomarinum sp. Ch1-1]MDP4519946.1 hypothetical protein [Methylomarinum sp. Ch1-1]
MKRIKSDGCDTNVGWIKRSGSTHVGRLREASRQTPPPGKNWPLCVSRRIAWRRIHPTMGQSDGCDTNVGRIKRSGSTHVGRLREASRQKPPPGAKLAVVPIQADYLATNPPYDGSIRRLRYQRRADQAQRIHPCRAASRSKPPKTATRGKIGRCAYPGGLPDGESTLRWVNPTVAIPT